MRNRMKRLGALALAGMLFATSGATSYAYNDYLSTSTWEWAEEHISWATICGIVAGKGNNCFDADGKVTRAEAATMMVNLKEIDVESYDVPCEQFADVGDKWYTKYINAAYANGLVAGKTETVFDPEGVLTRAEAAAMLVSAMGYELETEAEYGFEDIAGDWYTDYINTAYVHEVVAGKSEGIFDPSAAVTRAEIVTMIHCTTKESYEMGMIDGLWAVAKPIRYIISNAEGHVYDYDWNRTREEGGKVIGDLEIYKDLTSISSGSWTFYTMVPSSSFSLECDIETAGRVHIFGTICDLDISGTNIDKIRVDKDGTVYLYGTDMDYTVSIENMAHSVEYSDTGADDVVLKVVDKEFVEITE